MATGDYILSAALKATLTLTGQTFADADIASAISAASAGIDSACGRQTGFKKDATDATRYYTPFSRTLCMIDDLADVTSVAVDRDGNGTFEETWTENTQFIFEPLNAEADGRPREIIRIYPRAIRYFPPWPRSVQVVGKFGWDAVPNQIVQATTIIASKLLRRAREAPFGVLMLGVETAAHIGRQDPDVNFLLEDFMRTELVAA